MTTNNFIISINNVTLTQAVNGVAVIERLTGNRYGVMKGTSLDKVFTELRIAKQTLIRSALDLLEEAKDKHDMLSYEHVIDDTGVEAIRILDSANGECVARCIFTVKVQEALDGTLQLVGLMSLGELVGYFQRPLNTPITKDVASYEYY